MINQCAARIAPPALRDERLDAALWRGGFTTTFTVSIAADEVVDPKPAPDLYLSACARLGRPPARCLAFEDSITGARSALAAGLRLVSVPTLARPEFPGDWILSTLDDPDLRTWIGGWDTA